MKHNNFVSFVRYIVLFNHTFSYLNVLTVNNGLFLYSLGIELSIIAIYAGRKLELRLVFINFQKM